MLNLTRRNVLLTAAVAGAAFGLPKPVSFIEAALAQKGPEAGKVGGGVGISPQYPFPDSAGHGVQAPMETPVMCASARATFGQIAATRL